MEIRKAHDLFALGRGDIVTKRNMYDLIQYSKVPDSPYWGGLGMTIGNTPQQGINWIGSRPAYRGVVVKTRPGAYGDDGWSGPDEEAYQYSFKSVKGRINYNELANDALIQQPQYEYPVLLFTDVDRGWEFEGRFRIAEISDKYVTMTLMDSPLASASVVLEEILYPEGGRRFVSHLMTERSASVVAELKRSKNWLCEICNADFEFKYGVRYIEAHHKTPLATYSGEHVVSAKDLALLCPNCHKAVHLYMKQGKEDFEEVKKTIRALKSDVASN